MLAKSSLIASFALVAPAICIATAPLPSEQQITEFSTAFETAWKAGDLDALGALSVVDGIPQGTLDEKRGYWQMVLGMNQEERSLNGATFLSLADALTESPGRNTKAYREMSEDRVVNGRTYTPSLPVCGFMELNIFGGSGVSLPVGLDDQGKLRIAHHRPADPGLPGYQLSAPIAAPGLASGEVPEAVVERFKVHAKAAQESGNLAALYDEKGVPLDLLDETTIRVQMAMNPEEFTISEISFTPLAAMPEQMSEMFQKGTATPQKRGEHWYAMNGKLAGTVKFSCQSKSSRSVSGSLTTPAILTSEGELRLGLYVPVLPPDGE